MQLLDIELKNWGRHVSLRQKLSGNIIGLIGSNGSGKSTLLAAITYALTGELDRKQESYVSHLTDSKWASVSLRFQKNGNEGIIYRQIGTPAKRELVWLGETYTKAKDVEDTISEILGADKAAISNSVFIRQGEISKLVSGTQAERESVFMKLMHLQFLNTRVDALTSKIHALESNIVDNTPLIDAFNTELKELQTRKKVVEEELTDSPIVEERLSILESIANIDIRFQTTKEEQSRLIKSSLQEEDTLNYLKKDPIYKEINTLENLQQKEKEILSYKSYFDMKARIDKYKSAIITDSIELDNIRQRLIKDYKSDNINEIITYYNRLREELTLEINLLKERVKLEIEYHISRKNIEAHLTEYVESRVNKDNVFILRQVVKSSSARLKEKLGELSFKQKIKDLFKNTGNCPLCGSEISEDVLEQLSPEYLETLQKEIDNISDTIYRSEEQIQSIERCYNSIRRTIAKFRLKKFQRYIALKDIKSKITFIGTLADATKNKEYYDTTLDVLTSLAESIRKYTYSKQINEEHLKEIELKFKGVTSPYASLHELDVMQAKITSKINSINSFKVQFNDYESKYNALYAQALQCQKSLKELSSSREKLLADLQNNTFNIFTNVSLQVELDLIKDRVNNINQKRGELVTIEKSIALKTLHLHNAKKEQDALKNKINVINTLKTARTSLMRGGIPQVYMENVFSQLITKVQEILESINANFQVWSDEERLCTVKFSRNGEPGEMQQEQLSGGQQIRLAIALLIAVQNLLLPEVGLLVLDEPSTHVDEEGVESLRDLFQSLSSILKLSDSQIIVCDHNRILLSSFDTTIQLK